MSNLLHKLTPKFCVVIIVATFSPIVYITVIDQSFRLKIDNLPNEIATRKPVTAQVTTKNGNSNVRKKVDQKDKIKAEKERKHMLKEESQRLKKAELKLNAISKNSSRYSFKTHTNSSAVLGIKEQQFRLCPLLPKRLGELFSLLFFLMQSHACNLKCNFLFSPRFTKGNNFSDFLFASLADIALPNWVFS